MTIINISKIANEYLSKVLEVGFKLLTEVKDSVELNCIELNYENNQNIKDYH